MNPQSSAELSKMLKKFFKGEPLALGMVQIFTGILGIVFGIVIHMTNGMRTAYVLLLVPYWTGVLYIISGSLCVAAARNPKPSLVKGMLGMNVVSAVAAGLGIIFLGVSLDSATFFLYYSYNHCRGGYDHEDEECSQTQIFEKTFLAILIVLLLFTILEFCISISSAVFGCKNVCNNTYTETVVIVYQNQIPEKPVGPQPADQDPVSP